MSRDRAFQAALRALARRDFFARELVERLLRKGFQEQQAVAAVDRCVERGLIDDEKLAQRFVELKSVGRGWGPRRLCAELRRRGVAADLAERTSRLEAAANAEALQVAVERAERRFDHGWWSLPERQARMVSSLVSRGFEGDEARQAVAELAAQRERDDHAFHDQPGDPPSLS